MTNDQVEASVVAKDVTVKYKDVAYTEWLKKRSGPEGDFATYLDTEVVVSITDNATGNEIPFSTLSAKQFYQVVRAVRQGFEGN